MDVIIMEEFNYVFNLRGVKEIKPLPKDFAEVKAKELTDKIMENMKKFTEEYDFSKEE